MLVATDFHDRLKKDKEQQRRASGQIDIFLSNYQTLTDSSMGGALAATMLNHINPNVFVSNYKVINSGLFELVTVLNNIDATIGFFEDNYELIQGWWQRILKEKASTRPPAETLASILLIPKCIASNIESIVLMGDFNHPKFELTAHTMTQFIAGRLAYDFIEFLRQQAGKPS